MSRIFERYIRRKVLAGWQEASLNAPDTPAAQLRQQRDDARKLRTHLNRLIHEADGRLMRPTLGSVQCPRPLGTDWSCRPDLWRGALSVPGLAAPARRASLDPSVTVFHDCALSEIGLRQIRNTREKDLAPFGLKIEVFSFEGSFLSLSVDLPPEGGQGLTKQHLLRMSVQIEVERDISVTARLNIQNGPNTESILRALGLSADTSVVDFDLDHLPLNEGRIGKIWLDLILEEPRMNQIVLRDLTFCRHHRPDL